MKFLGRLGWFSVILVFSIGLISAAEQQASQYNLLSPGKFMPSYETIAPIQRTLYPYALGLASLGVHNLMHPYLPSSGVSRWAISALPAVLAGKALYESFQHGKTEKALDIISAQAKIVNLNDLNKQVILDAIETILQADSGYLLKNISDPQKVKTYFEYKKGQLDQDYLVDLIRIDFIAKEIDAMRK